MAFFKDLDLDFTRNPFSSDLTTKIDVNSVKQALRVLLLTNPGEKLFNPDYGCGISGMLFENLGMGTKIFVEERIKEQIFTYEPRVQVDNITFDDSGIDRNEIIVTLYFWVSGINILQNLHVSFKRIK